MAPMPTLRTRLRPAKSHWRFCPNHLYPLCLQKTAILLLSSISTQSGRPSSAKTQAFRWVLPWSATQCAADADAMDQLIADYTASVGYVTSDMAAAARRYRRQGYRRIERRGRVRHTTVRHIVYYGRRMQNTARGVLSGYERLQYGFYRWRPSGRRILLYSLTATYQPTQLARRPAYVRPFRIFDAIIDLVNIR